MMSFPHFLLFSSLFISNLTSYFTGKIRKDERIVFFPTLGRQLEDDGNEKVVVWDVPIHGWIFEPEKRDTRRRAFLALLRKSLNITHERDVLERRLVPFLVDNERLKSPRIRILGQEHRMPYSAKNGHFKASLRLETPLVENSPSTLQFEAILSSTDPRHFCGVVHMLPPKGLSVISDIDDTIKITNVTDKKSLLRNTFLQEFQPVPGMAQVYQEWEKDHGAKFHFVSSSPWQLYEELEDFRRRQGFPAASFHLKTIRPKDKTIFKLFADPTKTKPAQIKYILDRFSDRKFVLVGDSGEKDPEVYGQLARTYPDQIVKILIRNVVSSNDDVQDRMEMAFLGVPEEKWYLFVDAMDLRNVEF